MESIQSSIDMYTKEIQQLLQSFLGSLAEVFSRQRVYNGFGTYANDDTGTALVICMADKEN